MQETSSFQLKMRTRNFDGTHSAVVLLAALASRWRWLLKFVPPARVEKSLVMGSSSGDGPQFNCDTINVQCKKREVDRKYCSGRVWERVGLERFRSLNRR
jgi:hypothetical protein